MIIDPSWAHQRKEMLFSQDKHIFCIFAIGCVFKIIQSKCVSISHFIFKVDLLHIFRFSRHHGLICQPIITYRGKIILFTNFKFKKSLFHEALGVWILRKSFKDKDNFGRISWKSNFLLIPEIKILSMLLFFRFHASSYQYNVQNCKANGHSLLSHGIPDLK